MLTVHTKNYTEPASPEQIKEVYPFLTKRSAHADEEVKRRISFAFNYTRASKEAEVHQIKSVRQHLGQVIKALRVLENIEKGPARFVLHPLIGVQLPREVIKRHREIAEHAAGVFDLEPIPVM